MKGENGVPETPDWVGDRYKPPPPKVEPETLTIPPNIILGSE